MRYKQITNTRVTKNIYFIFLLHRIITCLLQWNEIWMHLVCCTLAVLSMNSNVCWMLILLSHNTYRKRNSRNSMQRIPFKIDDTYVFVIQNAVCCCCPKDQDLTCNFNWKFKSNCSNILHYVFYDRANKRVTMRHNMYICVMALIYSVIAS